MTQIRPIRADLVGAPIETLRSEAAALLASSTATLAPMTLYNDRRELSKWVEWADRHGLKTFPAAPADIGCHIMEMFDQRRTANAMQARLTALWHAHGSPSAPNDPTAEARHLLRALLAEERVVTPREPAPVLSIEEFVAMVEALVPSEDACIRHARWVLGWALRESAWLAEPIRASDMRFDRRDAWVAVNPSPGRTPESAAVVLWRDPNPLRCPVRAARCLVRYRPDRLIDGKLRIRALRTPTYRSITFKPRSMLFRGWTEEDFSYGVDYLAVPLRRVARDRAYICVGYAVAPQPGNLTSILIEHFRETRTGLSLTHPQSKTGTITLEPRDDALDPVAATCEWLSLWPFHSGPFLPGELHPDSIPIGGPRSGITTSSQLALLRRAAAAARLEVVPTPNSLRRSRTAHEWRKNKDIVAICDLLGHKDPSYTWDSLLAAYPLMVSAATDLVDRLSVGDEPESGSEAPHD